MAYTLVNCLGAEFSVDWSTVERLCMSYWRSTYQYEMATATTMSESTWYNPFSWSLPSIRTVDVPWEKVRDLARKSCAKDMADYQRAASRDMRGVALDVKWKVEQTARSRRFFFDYLREVQSSNMTEIDKAVDDYDGLIDAARFVRDTSADVVAIGSTVATGGAAAGLLGASSALKGWGKYQDTGSVGAATLYGAGSLVLGAFKVGGAKLTTGGDYTLIIVQGTLEAGTSLVAGDTFATAIERGGLKVASAGGAQAIFGTGMVKQVFARIPVPFNVWVKQAGKPMWVDEANDVLAKTAKKLTEKGIKSGIRSVDPGKSEAPRSSATGIIDDVPVEQLILLHFAIVNMRLGIGHGW